MGPVVHTAVNGVGNGVDSLGNGMISPGNAINPQETVIFLVLESKLHSKWNC